MAIAKNIEITAGSTTGFEDAVRTGIERASQTIDNIQGAWVKEQKVTVSEGQISEYRVTMIVSFILAED